jgi:hypothetical protein
MSTSPRRTFPYGPAIRQPIAVAAVADVANALRSGGH